VCARARERAAGELDSLLARRAAPRCVAPRKSRPFVSLSRWSFFSHDRALHLLHLSCERFPRRRRRNYPRRRPSSLSPRLSLSEFLERQNRTFAASFDSSGPSAYESLKENEGSMDEPSSHATSSSSSFIMHYLRFFHPSVIVYSFIHLSLYSSIVRQQRIAFSSSRASRDSPQWPNNGAMFISMRVCTPKIREKRKRSSTSCGIRNTLSFLC